MENKPEPSNQGAGPLSTGLLVVDQTFKCQIEEFLKQKYAPDQFQELTRLFNSDDIIKKHRGIIGIRKLISVMQNPPIQMVIDVGLPPKMIQLIKQTQYPQLQLEAAWILTNIAAGTTLQCKIIIDLGAIPLFINLLKQKNEGILEQAIWAIGNISSDCVENRNDILNKGGCQNLVGILNRIKNEFLIKHCCWALSNLCRGTPLPNYQQVAAAIPALCRIIKQQKVTDIDVLGDCCWAIAYHSDKTNQIDSVINSGIVANLIGFIEKTQSCLVLPAIRALGNISTGSVLQTQSLLSNNILPSLEKALSHTKKVVRREACWLLSNIAAGSKSQAESLYKCQSLIRQLAQMFKKDGEDVKRQICHIFANLGHSGDVGDIFNLFHQHQLLQCYINLLSSSDTKTIENALDCLKTILSQGKKQVAAPENPFVHQLIELKAQTAIEALQYHQSQNIYNKVFNLLQAYFTIEQQN